MIRRAVYAAALACAACPGAAPFDPTSRLTASTDTVDFGVTTANRSVNKTVTFTHAGTSPVEVHLFNPTDGAFSSGRFVRTVEAGGTFSIEVTFRGPALTNDEVDEQPHDSMLLVQYFIDGAKKVDRFLTLRLHATVVAPSCQLPEDLDFGAVLRGAPAHKSFVLENRSFDDDEAVVSGDPALPFTLARTGRIPVPAMTEQVVDVTLDTSVVGKSQVPVAVQPAGRCLVKNIWLIADVVDELITCFPLVFPLTHPGTSVASMWTMSNASRSDVTLTGLQSTSSAFNFAGTDTVVLPAGGSGSVRVWFMPSAAGQMNATLSANTSLPAVPRVACSVTATGGGPDVVVQSDLDFGQVPYFAAPAAPYAVTRFVRVLNRGSTALIVGPGTPTFQTPNASLTARICFGLPDANGDCMPFQWNPISPGFAMDVPVTVSAGAGGQQLEWTVHLVSNDMLVPAPSFTVRGTSVELPACQYVAGASAGLDFGLVSAPIHRELVYSVTNTGTAPCLLTELALEPWVDPQLQLVDPPAVPHTLAAGERLAVVIRAAPDRPVNGANGTLRVHLSAPEPARRLPLTAQFGPDCLVLPAAVDFGTVQTGCGAQVTVSVFNACTTAATLGLLALYPGAGAEMGLVGPFPPLALPAGGAPASFALSYRPVDVGADDGTLVVTVNNTRRVISLRGAGAAAAPVRETFVQAAKADVLLVVDSDPTPEWRNAFGMSSAAFIDPAVDFSIAAVSAEHLGSGSFVGSPRVLKPTTPALATAFEAKVDAVGMFGRDPAIAELAVAALTTPQAVGNNRGFLRDDASLGIVGLTNAGDGSRLPAATYAAWLSNLKPRNALSYSVIGPFFPLPPVGGCSYDVDAGVPLHHALVSALEGVEAEVCTADWPGTAAAVGKVAFGTRARFSLLQQVDGTKAITVAIDGALVPDGGWSFAPATNEVAVPLPRGATLTVDYTPVCL